MDSLLVAHPPRVLNETGSDGAEGPPPGMAGRYLSFEVTGARCAEDGISFSKDTQTVMRGSREAMRMNQEAAAGWSE